MTGPPSIIQRNPLLSPAAFRRNWIDHKSNCIYTNTPDTEAVNDLAASIDYVSQTCVAGHLRILNRVVTNIYDDAFRPLGLKVSQANILIVVAHWA